MKPPSLLTLFPFVKDGGFYVVEDLQTNYGDLSNDYRGIASDSCVNYLKKMADITVADEQMDLGSIEDPFLRTYGKTDYITFYRHMVVIKKKASRTSGCKLECNPISESFNAVLP